MMKAKTRKLIALILGVAMVLSLFTFTAAAVDEGGPPENAEGTIGEDIYWRIYDDHGEWALEIYGDGRIPDYASPDGTPWAAYRSGIAYIIVEKASYIGKNAFAGMSILESVTFYGDAPGFGESAFSDVSATCFFDFNNETWIDYVQQDYGGEIEWGSFNGPEGESVRGICGDGVFWMMPFDDYLMIHGKGEMYDYKSSADVPWAKFRNKIMDIRVNEDVKKIGNYAFADIPNVDTVSFLGDAPKFGENAFKNTTVFANYFSSTSGWDEDVLRNYGGEVTWEDAEGGDDDYQEIAGGEIGDNISWLIYYSEDILCLSLFGNGIIPDYASPEATPWASYRDEIEWVNINHNPSYIGNNAFAGFGSLYRVTFYGDAPNFGADAFKGTSAFCDVNGDNPTWTDIAGQDYGGNLDWSYYFYPIDGGMDGNYGDWVYYSHGALVISGDAALGDYASPDDTPWAKYKDDITSITINDAACIGAYALAGLTEKVYINFEGAAPDIAANAFAGTIALINCDGPSWTKEKMQDYGGEIAWNLVDTAYLLDDGQCGENAEWALYDNGVLFIDGYGAIYDYESDSGAPWAAYRNIIRHILVRGDITYVGKYAFAGLPKLRDIDFWGDAPNFGENSFYNTTTDLLYDADTNGWADKIENYGGFIFWTPVFDTLIVAEGDCGHFVNWTLRDDNKLIIYGTGRMFDYYSPDDVPWAEYRDRITSVEISDPISYIGDYAFAHMFNPCTFEFKCDAPAFGKNVFEGDVGYCYSDNEEFEWPVDVLQEYGGNIEWNLNGRPLEIGYIDDDSQWVYYPDGRLVVYSDGALRDYASADDTPWAKYRDEIRYIAISVNGGVGDNAFAGLSNVRRITIYGGATTFGKNVFGGITANVWYDGSYHEWSSDARQNYGGELTWKGFDLKGDVNRDGVITNADLILVARYVVELLEPDSFERYMVWSNGDVSSDGQITNADIIMIARIIVGLE